MAALELTVLGVPEVVADLELLGSAAIVKAGTITRHFGQMLLTKVRANTQSATHKPGRPHIGGYQGEGPNKATANYQRSWGLEMLYGGIGPEAHVGTNAPQARRLEQGFIGQDSLGRNYHQLPLPHAGPALDEIAPEFAAALVEVFSL